MLSGGLQMGVFFVVGKLAQEGFLPTGLPHLYFKRVSFYQIYELDFF